MQLSHLPLHTKWVLPDYGDPDALPFEIVCDTREIAQAHRERPREAET